MRVLEIKEYHGGNIYSHYPVVKGVIDLEDLSRVWCDQVAGFTERLCAILPGLRQHHCSRGYAGGFVERLREGTLFGHIIEHVALELQSMAGFPAMYGKTLSTDEPGVYEVVLEADVMECGKEAIYCAIHLLDDILKNREPKPCLGEIISRLQEVNDIYGLGPSTSALLAECKKRDIPVLPLGYGSLIQLGYGCRQQRIQAALTGHTSCIGVDIACNKELAKKIMEDVGIPIPAGRVVQTEEKALEVAELLGYPVVIKPRSGNQGKGVSLNLHTRGEIRTAFRLAQIYDRDVLVEKQVPGRHYRLLVVGKRVVAAAERLPAQVRGDGLHTVDELVEMVNTDPLRGKGHEKPLTRISLDETALLVLAKQKIRPGEVPPEGRVVLIRENANLSTGGTAVDVTARMHPLIESLAIRAAGIVGLDVAGVDLVAPDISQDPQKGAAIIEVNAAPGIRMHLYPSEGKGRNVAAEIIEYLFPEGREGRIPVIAVTGTNGKTTTTRLIGSIFHLWGKRVGMTTSDGIYQDGECIMSGDTTGPHSAQVVLKDPGVEVAVLETARGGILRAGLGYDQAQVGVITNISKDHLGLEGIEDLAQMAMVKALVVEALVTKGTAVLNADDPWCMDIVGRVRENLVLFSLVDDNIAVKRHLATGQTAFFVKNGYLVYAQGEQSHKLLSLKEIPLSMQGLAAFNIANVLAAAAACFSAGVPVAVIKQGIRTFGLQKWHNPGRCQVYRLDGVRVILDYGHNAAAFESIFKLARLMNPGRLLGVVGVPGDRRDKDIIEAGKICGAYLDYCIIKEDRDLRGRDSGEVASLLMEGLSRQKGNDSLGEIVLNELEATVKGLGKCRPGDILIIFYEKLDPIQSFLDKMERKAKERAENGVPEEQQAEEILIAQ